MRTGEFATLFGLTSPLCAPQAWGSVWIPPILGLTLAERDWFIRELTLCFHRSVLVVLAFRSQVLMPLIMSRDLKGFRSLLNTVENNQDAAWAKVFYQVSAYWCLELNVKDRCLLSQSLLNERCDGQRNVLHMSIEMSVPSSNKEQREDEEAQSKVSASGEQATSLRLSPSKSVANTGSNHSFRIAGALWHITL